jgi:DNA-binding CsgD family transcriptional regulator
MIGSDVDWLAVVDAIQSAGVGAHSWETALQSFADATGSRSAQLAGFDSNTALGFNIMTNVDPELSKIIAGTVSINPRVKPVSDAPVLRVIAEADFMAPEEWRRHPFYQEIAVPWDLPFIAMTNLERQKNTFVVLAAIRSQRDGHITPEQRDIFTTLALHVRTAVRTHRALEGHGTAVLIGAMEAVLIPVFICDHYGRVKSHTQAADLLLQANRGLLLTAGSLGAHHSSEARALTEAIAASTGRLLRPGPPTLRTVVVHGELRTDPLVLDVFPLPASTHQLSFEPWALVVARGHHASTVRCAALLRMLYALTTAEIEIAQALADGKSANEVADARAVSVGTVRTQLKTIMAKLGVSRQVELVLRLSQL